MLLFALFACNPPDDTDVERDVVAEITSPGAWTAGYHRSEVTYVDEVSGVDRTLFLASWYPTSATVGAGEVRYHGLVEDTAVLLDAPCAEGAFPVAVFSHGHQGYAENSSFLMRHLATHGWVVLAPDHTGNTTFDGSDRETPIYRQRPRDLSAVLDHAADSASGEPFAGHTTELIVGFGHSFGGYTIWAIGGASYDEAAIAACLDGSDTSSYCSTMTEVDADVFRGGLWDDRVAGVVPMAAGDVDRFGAAGVAAVDVPVLMMTAELDHDDADAFWTAVQGSSSEHHRVVLAGAGHQSFTDLSGMIEDVPIDPAEGWRIVDAYGLAFAERLRGDDAMQGVIDGSLIVSTEAEVLP